MSRHFDPERQPNASIGQSCVRCDRRFRSSFRGTLCRGCVAELLEIDAIEKDIAAQQEEEYGNKKSDRNS